MIRRISLATLSAVLVLGTAGSANAFFGMFGGGDCGCGCEPSCGCHEATCGCEPSCGCDSHCGRRGCFLFDGLCGLFDRNDCCCEADCGCEPSCGCHHEAHCGCEPSCGCDSGCCDRGCGLFYGLCGRFSFRNHGCCEADCGCEPSCGCNGGMVNGSWGY